MASYNRVILVGNVTRVPELKYLPNGTAVCDIGIAVNEQRKGANGEKVEEVTFCDITYFARVAEVCGEYVTRGMQILVEGRLKQDTWQDKETGAKRSKLKIIGDKMEMLGSKPAREQPQNEYHQPSPPGEGVDAPPKEDGDVPF